MNKKENLLKIIYNYPESALAGTIKAFSFPVYQKDNRMSHKSKDLTNSDKAEVAVFKVVRDKIIMPVLGYTVLTYMYLKNKFKH